MHLRLPLKAERLPLLRPPWLARRLLRRLQNHSGHRRMVQQLHCALRQRSRRRDRSHRRCGSGSCSGGTAVGLRSSDTAGVPGVALGGLRRGDGVRTRAARLAGGRKWMRRRGLGSRILDWRRRGGSSEFWNACAVRRRRSRVFCTNVAAAARAGSAASSSCASR